MKAPATISAYAMPGLYKGLPDNEKAAAIKAIVSRHFNVSYLVLSSSKQTRTEVMPRMFAAYFIYNCTDLTLKHIGSLLGRRDHSTIIHGIQTVNNLLEIYESYRQIARELRHELELENIKRIDRMNGTHQKPENF